MDEQQLIRRWRRALGRIGEIPAGYARLGQAENSLTLVADFKKRMVYYYDAATGQPTGKARLAQSINITAINHPSMVGTRVRLGYPPGAPHVLHVLELDDGEGLDAVGGLLPGEQLIAKALYPDIGSILNLRLQPDSGTDLYVQAGAYFTPAGQWAWFGGDIFSTSTLISGLASGKHQMLVVCLDTNTGELAGLTNTAVDGGVNDKDAFDQNTVSAMAWVDGYQPCGVAHLYYAQTTVTEDDIYRHIDPRVGFGASAAIGYSKDDIEEMIWLGVT